MMGSRPAQEPAEIIIWTATGLLGALLGAGTAYAVWTALHHTAQRGFLTGAVCALGLGLTVLGWTVNSATARIFAMVFGLALIVAFFLGGPAFATLNP